MFDLDQLFQKSELIPSDHPACPDQGRADAGLYESGGSGADAPDKDCRVLGAGARGKLWNKGETSGHFLHVEQIFTDCDTDTLLYFCLPDGPTCHTGRDSCFFRRLCYDTHSSAGGVDSPFWGADRRMSVNDVWKQLYQVVQDRKASPQEGSYTCYLFDKGAG